MNVSARFERLRDLCHRRPSASTWTSLCLVLHEWPGPEELTLALDYIEQHLEPWPDALRVCPQAWWDHHSVDDPEPRLAICRVMRLSRNHLGAHGIHRLTDTSQLERLTALEIHADVMGNDGVEAIVRSRYLHNLHTLSLTRCALDDRAIEHLVRWPHLHKLRRLLLSENDLTDVAAIALAACPHLSRLELLALADNHIDDDGAVALAKSDTLLALDALDLKRNPIGPYGASVLGECEKVAAEAREWWRRFPGRRMVF